MKKIKSMNIYWLAAIFFMFFPVAPKASCSIIFGLDTIPQKNSDVLIRKLPLGTDKKVALPGETRANFPLDTTVKTGKLENGLSYYLMQNPGIEKSIEWRLVVQAGSVFEDDVERGATRFIEHLAFSGTEHFGKNEIRSLLESSGMKFGKDFGARTGWEESVFYFKTRSEDHKLNDLAFLFLKDWANGMDFDSIEVESIRTGLLVQMQKSRSAEDMFAENEIKALLMESRYADRLPDADAEKINAVSALHLENFYVEWFRPDRMALVIAGDFDLVKMEENIKANFSGLQLPSSYPKRVRTDFKPNNTPVVLIQTDGSLSQTHVKVQYKHPKRPVREYFTYRQGLVSRLCNMILEERFSQINDFKENPFFKAYSGYQPSVGNLDVFVSGALTKEAQVQNTLRDLLIEQERLIRYGFTIEELEKAKDALVWQNNQNIADKAVRKNQFLAERMVRHFLFAEPLLSPEQEGVITTQYLPNIQLKDVNKMVRQWMPAHKQIVLISGPAEEGLIYPDEKTVLELMEEVKNMEIDRFEDHISNQEK